MESNEGKLEIQFNEYEPQKGKKPAFRNVVLFFNTLSDKGKEYILSDKKKMNEFFAAVSRQERSFEGLTTEDNRKQSLENFQDLDQSKFENQSVQVYKDIFIQLNKNSITSNKNIPSTTGTVLATYVTEKELDENKQEVLNQAMTNVLAGVISKKMAKQRSLDKQFLSKQSTVPVQLTV